MNENGRERSTFADLTAAQIRAERAAADLTQAQLIEASGIPRSTYIRLESGTRVADTTQLARISTALGLPLSEFFRRVEARMPGD